MMPMKVASMKVDEPHIAQRRQQIAEQEREDRHQAHEQQIVEAAGAEAFGETRNLRSDEAQHDAAQAVARDQEDRGRAGGGADHGGKPAEQPPKNTPPPMVRKITPGSAMPAAKA